MLILFAILVILSSVVLGFFVLIQNPKGGGLSSGFGGIGKIIGPLGLALIVGSSNFVKPDVPLSQIPTAFFYLGAWYVLAGAVYLFLGIETKGRSIQQIDRDLAEAA